jgi:mono/diheme cytochrome c family protein
MFVNRVLGALVMSSLFAGLGTTAQAQQLPEGVTEKMIAEGSALYGGVGICLACHGPDGKGIPNLGADLTDDEWLQSDGTYASILRTILEGVAAENSTSGTVMPPKGGSQLSEEQVRAVAAYVWSLRRKS